MTRLLVIVVLASAAWVVGCTGSERIVAAPRPDVAPSDAGRGAFGTPQPITGLLDPGDHLQDVTLSSDELEIYFSTDKLGTLDIWKSTRPEVGQPWTRAVVVAELSTSDRDVEPDLDADGLTIYLSRDPIATDPDFRVFVSHRASRTSPWSPAEVVSLGEASTDRGPTIARNGLNLAFASTRAGGTFDLYLADRPTATVVWETPRALSELNSAGEDWDPKLFRDGLALVFASRRPSATSDLFETNRPDTVSGFGAAIPLTELNSPTSEGDPWLSNDGRHIVFTSDRSGTSQLYEAWR